MHSIRTILFRPIALDRVDDADADASKIGGNPTWVLDDESPKSYGGKHEMVFLLQLEPGLTFETGDSAPAQITLGLDGKPRPSSKRHYELFIGNAVYLFGVRDAEPLVYAITQI